ncbi:sensor histidine kinase [Nitrospira moscoviensis]|uniref:histidine kinase n=1 Tax=Nitrospira moscoviensis TaxID=42253 RepID=A0A0K2GHJ7_NITMO|nr:ATP-binding protein [Nitrospira moscoviensis]ALA60420.1 putative Histidine kinase [Nitrospira moscoviensis]
MAPSIAGWWRRLTVQRKVWTVLGLLLVPLLLSLGLHLYITSRLLAIQQERQSVLLAREYIHVIHRLAIDGEDAYHGYILTQRPEFATALTTAESELARVLQQMASVEASRSTAADALRGLAPRLQDLQVSLRTLTAGVQSRPRPAEAVRSHLLSDGLRKELRAIEDRLDVVRRALNRRAERLSAWAFAELWCALAGLLAIGWIGSRLLARSITEPIARLQSAAAAFGRQVDPGHFTALVPPERQATDELGRLAHAYRDMAVRVATHIHELETLAAIGQDITAIGPDGADGVLRRITDRAVELVEADVCLVMLRNDKMGCWVVEVASGEWNERLYKSVMLWEEFPVSVQAFETRRVAYGSDLQRDQRPEVVRRNLLGSSMIAVPLLSRGESFGVLVLLSRQARLPEQWHTHLAVGLAQQAAVAIANARLYEAAQERQKGLLARLRHLEYLAGTLAHDLKGPGQRMQELTALIYREYQGQLDARVDRWLGLLRDNGRDLVERVEGILEVARVGAGVGPIRAVDPALVLADVLKAWAGDLERRQGRVTVETGLPMVACHAAYLRQIFDNVVSNALKYAAPDRPVRIHVSAQRREHMVCFAMRDNGIGIPKAQRARVFEPFVRLRQSDAEGSGIGLTIVHRIVELYGGTVWIEGDEGAGCTVRFTLPWLHDGLFAPDAPLPPASSTTMTD